MLVDLVLVIMDYFSGFPFKIDCLEHKIKIFQILESGW